MKVLKRANQKNVRLDGTMYTIKDVVKMLSNKQVVWFKDIYNDEGSYKTMEFTYDVDDVFELEKAIEDEQIRVFLEGKDELKVVNIDGYYYTILTTKDGNMFYVTL